MSNGKVILICLIVLLIKKISLYKMNYFPEPFSHTINDINLILIFKLKVKLDSIQQNLI